MIGELRHMCGSAEGVVRLRGDDIGGIEVFAVCVASEGRLAVRAVNVDGDDDPPLGFMRTIRAWAAGEGGAAIARQMEAACTG